MAIRISALFLALLCSTSSFAEEISDPMRPLEREVPKAAKSPYGVPVPALSAALPGPDGSLVPITGDQPIPTYNGLQSVITTPHEEAALVDGRWIKLGEMVMGYKLAKVTETGVVLEREKQVRKASKKGKHSKNSGLSPEAKVDRKTIPLETGVVIRPASSIQWSKDELHGDEE